MIHRIILDSIFCGLFVFLLVAAASLRSRLRRPKSLLFLVLIFEIFGFGMRIVYDVQLFRQDEFSYVSRNVDYGPSSYMITVGGACFVALLAGILRGHQHSLTEDTKINKPLRRPRSLHVLDVLIFVSSLCILLGFVSIIGLDERAAIAGPIFILIGLGGDLLALILIAMSTFRHHVRSWRTLPEREAIAGFFRRIYAFWRHCPWTIVVLYIVTILTFVRTIIRSVYYALDLLYRLVVLHFISQGRPAPFKSHRPEEYVPICDGFLTLLSIAAILTLRPISVASNTTAREEYIRPVPPAEPEAVQIPQDQVVEKA